MTSCTVHVDHRSSGGGTDDVIMTQNVTDDVISLDKENEAFIGGRAFNLHALPDDFQVN